jgi:tripartite-type tricarboxylate transporter receptor subunit TctC
MNGQHMHDELLSPREAQRRALLRTLLAGAAGAGAWHAASAQEAYPSHPVRVVVPFGPGGLADISMRIIAQKLGERMGQSFIIDNKPGAGGVVAATGTLAAPRDGYTLIMFTNGTAIGKSLFKLGYDPETDFVPVSTLTYFDLVLLTRSGRPMRDLQTLLAQGQQRSLTFGTINPGSTQNLSAELFRSVANLKVKAELVPFKSTPEVLTALMRGDIDVAFESYAALKGAIDAGQVNAIAATGARRSPWLPKVPTVREAGLPGYEVTGWNALYAPRGVSAAAIESLNRNVGAVMRMPDVRDRLIQLGTEVGGSTAEELAATFRRDAAKWAEVIRAAGIKVQ